MENKYWWVWLGIGVNLAYILLMNVIIVICLAYLPGESCFLIFRVLAHTAQLLCVCQSGDMCRGLHRIPGIASCFVMGFARVHKWPIVTRDNPTWLKISPFLLSGIALSCLLILPFPAFWYCPFLPSCLTDTTGFKELYACSCMHSRLAQIS